MVAGYQVGLNGILQALVEPIQYTLDGDYIDSKDYRIALNQLHVSYQIGLNFELNPDQEHYWFHYYRPMAEVVNGINVQPHTPK